MPSSPVPAPVDAWAVVADQFPILVHYSAKPIGQIKSAINNRQGHFKPCGLWVSVEGNGDGWREWCEDEDFHLESLSCQSQIDLAHDAHILWIRTPNEIDNFTDEYALEVGTFRTAMDWQSVARKYQGIIIAPYQWSRRLSDRNSWYYSWDCASGCIWDASAIARVIPVTITPKPEERT